MERMDMTVTFRITCLYCKKRQKKIVFENTFSQKPIDSDHFLYVNCHSGTCRIVKFNFYINTFYSTDDEL